MSVWHHFHLQEKFTASRLQNSLIFSYYRFTVCTRVHYEYKHFEKPFFTIIAYSATPSEGPEAAVVVGAEVLVVSVTDIVSGVAGMIVDRNEVVAVVRVGNVVASWSDTVVAVAGVQVKEGTCMLQVVPEDAVVACSFAVGVFVVSVVVAVVLTAVGAPVFRVVGVAERF